MSCGEDRTLAHADDAGLAIVAWSLVVGLPAFATEGTSANSRRNSAKASDTEQVRAIMRRAADWQLAHPVRFGPQHWAIAPLYNGLIDASLTLGDPRYLAPVLRTGERVS